MVDCGSYFFVALIIEMWLADRSGGSELTAINYKVFPTAINGRSMAKLDSEEYVEQSYLFRTLGVRIRQGESMQRLLGQVREEVLATTKLPMAIDYLSAELNHVGTMGSAMALMPHYFAPFQTFVMESAESEVGRFDMGTALRVLEFEATFRAEDATPAGLFFFQFETLARNRLVYDYGLAAMAKDGFYPEDWQSWILKVRHQIGIVDLADLVYVHSEHYITRQSQILGTECAAPDPLLFGEKEGRIALANRSKEPQIFFAALQRQLKYPQIPKPPKKNRADEVLPKLMRTVERMEMRVKLLEDEQRQKGIDLSKFYKNQD